MRSALFHFTPFPNVPDHDICEDTERESMEQKEKEVEKLVTAAAQEPEAEVVTAAAQEPEAEVVTAAAKEPEAEVVTAAACEQEAEVVTAAAQEEEVEKPEVVTAVTQKKKDLEKPKVVTVAAQEPETEVVTAAAQEEEVEKPVSAMFGLLEGAECWFALRELRGQEMTVATNLIA
ncbi:hypothetical protein FN846DRAFT_915103 [Sphaerosporella brunnea]|uniref:Uncharacterized protein n=1 Tax=Sphaerosporella brunnea TaxID=1250544 RepID=A0A5J5EC26_9PEZI|nr:hypothetical protein FN846DRAFT_915103 [Sphaerosporella brunnea]